jgi:hypothetical protein
MYPLPEDFQSSYLVGKCIESICFAEFHISLNFSGEVTLQIEGRYEFKTASGIVERHGAFPIEQSSLPSVVGDTVKALEFDRPSGDLTLLFARDARLHIHGDSGPYESYILSSKSGDIFV